MILYEFSLFKKAISVSLVVDGECTKCGNVIYIRDNEDDSIIYFGTYPQSKVSDTTLISTLSTKAGALPTEYDSYNWTSYGYYISGSVSNYMWYIDINYNNEKYRGVYFTSYRPYWTAGSSSTSNSHQDDNGYSTSTVYWFKYETIKWLILEESSGKAFLLADIALDSQEYYVSDSNRTIDGNTANNYEYSTIRKWLNETFYNTTFSELEKEIILTTKVDNSLLSTGDSTNNYICNDTNDKIFLLSKKEVRTYFTTDALRIKQSTDYAKSQGCYSYSKTSSSYLGNSSWCLRSPDYSISDNAGIVYYDGIITNLYNVLDTDGGVVPALWITL